MYIFEIWKDFKKRMGGGEENMYILIDGEKAKKTVFTSYDEARDYVNDKYDENDFDNIKLYELGQEYTVIVGSESCKTKFKKVVAE